MIQATLHKKCLAYAWRVNALHVTLAVWDPFLFFNQQLPPIKVLLLSFSQFLWRHLSWLMKYTTLSPLSPCLVSFLNPNQCLSPISSLSPFTPLEASLIILPAHLVLLLTINGESVKSQTMRKNKTWWTYRSKGWRLTETESWNSQLPLKKSRWEQIGSQTSNSALTLSGSLLMNFKKLHALKLNSQKVYKKFLLDQNNRKF